MVLGVLRKYASHNSNYLSRRFYRVIKKRSLENIVDSSNSGFSQEERDYQIDTVKIKIEYKPLYDLPDYYLADGTPGQITLNQTRRHRKRLLAGFSIKEAFTQVNNAEKVNSQAYLDEKTLRYEQKSYAISKNVSNYIADLNENQK